MMRTGNDDEFHWFCRGGVKRLDNHLLLWGRPRSRFPLHGMVGPDWRIVGWTFCFIPLGTAGWACLIILSAPSDGADTVRSVIVSAGVVLALVAMFLYLSTACSDPGIVFKHLAQSASSSARAGEGDSGVGRATAPAGAGTPVRFELQAGGRGGAGSVLPGAVKREPPGAAAVQRGFGASGASFTVVEGGGSSGDDGSDDDDDVDDDVEQGDHQHTITTTTYPTATLGLPPEMCIEAADAGSASVIDMRNFPPPSIFESGRGTPAVFPFLPAPPQPQITSVEEDVGEGAQAPATSSTNVCGRCDIVRPEGTMHCHICGVCVQRLDHHCPFMGQCVGRKTLCTFYAFIIAVWILIIYVLLAVAYLVIVVVAHGL